MSDAYTIELKSTTIGLVVRDQSRFRFFATNPAFVELDGFLFNNAAEAEAAAAHHSRRRIRNAACRRG